MGPWSTGISVLIRRDTKELAPFPTLRKKKRERERERKEQGREGWSKGKSEEKRKKKKQRRTKERKSPEDTARRLTPASQE